MMNRIKSTRLHLVKFLFLLPMLAVLLLAFRDRYENRKETVLQGYAARTLSFKLPGSELQPILPSDILHLRNDTLHLRSDTLHLRRDTLPQRTGDGYQGAGLRTEKGQGNTSKGAAPLLIGLRSDTLPPLHIVNGEPMPENWSIASIPETEIKSVDVLKGDQAIRLFGAKGAGGVIAITTKDGKMYGETAQIKVDNAQIMVDNAQIKRDTMQIKLISVIRDGNKIGIKSDTIHLLYKKKDNPREKVN